MKAERPEALSAQWIVGWKRFGWDKGKCKKTPQ
jgi:hypothetical protein